MPLATSAFAARVVSVDHIPHAYSKPAVGSRWVENDERSRLVIAALTEVTRKRSLIHLNAVPSDTPAFYENLRRSEELGAFGVGSNPARKQWNTLLRGRGRAIASAQEDNACYGSFPHGRKLARFCPERNVSFPPIADLGKMDDRRTVKIAVAIVASLICSSCVAISNTASTNASVFAVAVPFCQMIKNRQAYLEGEVRVRAFWVSNDHGSQIFDDAGNCLGEAIWVRNPLKHDKRAASIVSSELRREHYPEVVLEGRLQRRHFVLTCEEDSCFEYFFGNFRIVAAPGHPFHDLSQPYRGEK